MTRQKKHRNGAGWNKDQSQGVKSHFTQVEVSYLVQSFVFEENWHDLALLLVALDTALRAGDLLQLKVGDVCYSDGRLRRKLARRQQKTSKPVEPVLTPLAQRALARWIKTSGKTRDAFFVHANQERARRKTDHASASQPTDQNLGGMAWACAGRLRLPFVAPYQRRDDVRRRGTRRGHLAYV